MQPGIGFFPMHSFDNSALRSYQNHFWSQGYDKLCHNNLSVVERARCLIKPMPLRAFVIIPLICKKYSLLFWGTNDVYIYVTKEI